MDHVDRIVAQWEAERPDLALASMALVGRLKRAARCMERAMEVTFAEFGLNLAGFDVLATLRRSGAPYRLSPGALLENTMVTSGTMTNRIDQLERAGLVVRRRNPEDGRSVLIELTDDGFGVIDEAVTAHVETLDQLTEALSDRDFAQLDRQLRRWLAGLETTDAPE